jgi:peptidyl-prolyl cis-trans isomerase A (cyclophilin A)
MILKYKLFIFKLTILCAFITVIISCGGNNNFLPVVTGVKVQSALYDKVATIYIGGKDLRTNLNVDTSGACTNSSFSSKSTTDMLEFKCSVTKTGDFPFRVKTADGVTIFVSTLNIPLPQVVFITSKGSITLELNPTLAPLSTNNFLNYVDNSFFRSTIFHRVIPNFVIQGGGYTSGLVKKAEQNPPIELESNKGLSNLRGTLAMARTSVPNSAMSEFFINLVDNLSLDYKNAESPGYAVFGKVVQGMDVVDAIAAEPTGVVAGFNDVPLTDVTLSLALRVK